MEVVEVTGEGLASGGFIGNMVCCSFDVDIISCECVSSPVDNVVHGMEPRVS